MKLRLSLFMAFLSFCVRCFRCAIILLLLLLIFVRLFLGLLLAASLSGGRLVCFRAHFGMLKLIPRFSKFHWSQYTDAYHTGRRKLLYWLGLIALSLVMCRRNGRRIAAYDLNLTKTTPNAAIRKITREKIEKNKTKQYT